MKNEYLTESSVSILLDELYPNVEFVQNRSVPGSGVKFRPDYRSDVLKLIVEFDDYLHYTKNSQVLRDIEKDRIYTGMGYRVVRIPYFVQMDKYIIELLFGIDVKERDVYPHGFIDSKAIQPVDFCEAGLERFIRELNMYDYIYFDILNSLEILPSVVARDLYGASKITVFSGEEELLVETYQSNIGISKEKGVCFIDGADNRLVLEYNGRMDNPQDLIRHVKTIMRDVLVGEWLVDLYEMDNFRSLFSVSYNIGGDKRLEEFLISQDFYFCRDDLGVIKDNSFNEFGFKEYYYGIDSWVDFRDFIELDRDRHLGEGWDQYNQCWSV